MATFLHKARKRFGQNFLHDLSVIQNIIESISPTKTDHLVEIGPGQGALTEFLIKDVHQLDAIELDTNLVPFLKARFEKYEQFVLHQGDALRFDFNQLSVNGEPIRLVGNLPYNIATSLIFYLLSFKNILSDMHFMLQKEVAERLVSSAGCSQYGRLSVMIQYHCKVEYLFTVPPHCFRPAPKVESAIVRLIPHSEPLFLVQDIELLDKVVKLAFNQRRKTLRNTLRPLLGIEDFHHLELNPKDRAEQLSVEDFSKITNYLSCNS